MGVRVKICGVTTVADAALAAQLGADFIGLNFYAQSPRCVAPAAAAEICRGLPESAQPVGVFVNETIAHVRQILGPIGIRIGQMHGAHGENLMPGCQWIPAFSIRDASSLVSITSCLKRLRSGGEAPFAILVDAHVPGQYGGTGQTAPWHLLADFKPPVPLILAGGLTPENVAEAIRIVRPFAVDVASGVESSPGKKDSDKMRRFIDAVRASE